MPSPTAVTSTSKRFGQEAGITVTLPKPMNSNAKAEGRFGKQHFCYVADEDIYACPAGEKLAYHYTTEENSLVLRRYWTNVCQSCAIKPTCTTGKQRRITRWDHEHLLEAVQRRLDEHPEEDAPAARDGRASLRHHQGQDGSHTLPDEDAAARCLRDGSASVGLQSHPGDEHHRCPAVHSRRGVGHTHFRRINARLHLPLACAR